MIRYKCLSIDFDKLLNTTRCIPEDKEIDFSINFKDGLNVFCCVNNDSPKLRFTYRSDSALFFQIREVLKDKPGANFIDDSDCLFRSIIIVDFKCFFNKVSINKIEDIVSKIGNEDSDNEYLKAFKTLMDPNKGINITFKDGSTKRFTAFDRSGSMSRNCKMTFIDSEIREAVDRRLRLDIDFNSIELELSKYYAYRGLYLSNSKRIEQEEGEFELNENTFIVLKDKEDSRTPISTDDTRVIDGTEARNSFPRIFTSDNIGEYTIRECREEVKINEFDGLGIISPEYTEYINRQVHPGKTANSFQIRMPFAKGMLHNVNFRSFFDEFYKEDANMEIEDCFGKKRSLSNAQIIITESMFKCKKWLVEYWKRLSEEEKGTYKNDPMNYYFKKFKEYNHSLHIREDDTSMHGKEYERLNYQYLSTLGLSKEDINKLVKGHFKKSDKIIKSKIKKGSLVHSDSLLAASRENSKFLNEPLVKERILLQIQNHRIDCGIGRLFVEGEGRYLSADLLRFLLYIAKKAEADYRFSFYKDVLKAHCLTSESYLPGLDYSKEDRRFVILRNPHLSRNEEFISTRNIAVEEYFEEVISVFEETSNSDISFTHNPFDLYNKYFAHLTGIIMIPSRDFGAEAMGGADFDGDKVKIYRDSLLCDAVINDCYDKEKIKEGALREMSVVKIPGASGIEKHYPNDLNENIKLILNTFSNQTGIISNLATKFALTQYAPGTNPQEASKDYCAQCTLVTGLEIDSVKKGKHPIKEIEHIKSKYRDCDKNQRDKADNYIKYIKAMKGSYGGRSATVKPAKDDSKYELTINGNKFKISQPDNKDHALFHLQYEFIKCVEKATSTRDNETAGKIIAGLTQKTPEYYFTFEQKPNWKKDLKKTTDYKEKSQKLENLISAYFEIKKYIRKYEKELQNTKSANIYGKLFTLLKLKYDYTAGSYYPDKEKEFLMHRCLEEVRSCLSDKEKIEAALITLSKEWCFTNKESRTETLYEMLQIDKNKHPLDNDVIQFLTDFSFGGYNTLYYLIKLVLQEKRFSAPIEDIVENPKIDNNYFKELLKEYKAFVAESPIKEFEILTEDLDDSEDNSEAELPHTDFFAEEDDSDVPLGFISNETDVWDNRLNEKAYELLKEIISESDTELLIKHLWSRRNSKDTWKDKGEDGLFLWNVVPKEIVLEHIYGRRKKC